MCYCQLTPLCGLFPAAPAVPLEVIFAALIHCQIGHKGRGVAPSIKGVQWLQDRRRLTRAGAIPAEMWERVLRETMGGSEYGNPGNLGVLPSQCIDF